MGEEPLKFIRTTERYWRLILLPEFFSAATEAKFGTSQFDLPSQTEEYR